MKNFDKKGIVVLFVKYTQLMQMHFKKGYLDKELKILSNETSPAKRNVPSYDAYIHSFESAQYKEFVVCITSAACIYI